MSASNPSNTGFSGRANPGDLIRLHIGGVEPREGWTMLNAQAMPGVDVVGRCEDLSMFATGSVEEVYASHVYEHLGYRQELPGALREACRVLRPGGVFRAGVPDLDALCRLFLKPGLTVDQRSYIMAMMYGGQKDEWDFHKVGMNFEMFAFLLKFVGFSTVERAGKFGVFNDITSKAFDGVSISLNVVARK